MPFSISDIKVTGVVPDSTTDLSGMAVDVMRVFYVIADNGPYNVAIPKVEATAQRALNAVRDDAQRFIDILNLTF